jgi:hypothetical protein
LRTAWRLVSAQSSASSGLARDLLQTASVSRFARSLTALSAVAVAAASCQEHAPPGVAEMQGDSTGAVPLWVTFRRDPKCEAAADCGWLLRELNRHEAEICVDAIDLDGAGLSEAMIPGVLGAPDGTVVLSGERRNSSFVARQVFRGLPGAQWSPADLFVQVAARPVCESGACESGLVALNTDIDVLAPVVQLSAAEAPWLQTSWLEDRVQRRSAVLAGRLLGDPGERIQRFEASQAFVPLPDRVGPCARPRLHGCAPGTVAVFGRDVDRCVIQTGCARPRSCRDLPPVCDQGYALRSWHEQPGCRAYACDAAFLP